MRIQRESPIYAQVSTAEKMLELARDGGGVIPTAVQVLDVAIAADNREFLSAVFGRGVIEEQEVAESKALAADVRMFRKFGSELLNAAIASVGDAVGAVGMKHQRAAGIRRLA